MSIETLQSTSPISEGCEVAKFLSEVTERNVEPFGEIPDDLDSLDVIEAADIADHCLTCDRNPKENGCALGAAMLNLANETN